MAERLNRNNLLKESLNSKGVDTLVCDLDNTVWDIQDIFRSRVKEISEKKPGIYFRLFTD